MGRQGSGICSQMLMILLISDQLLGGLTVAVNPPTTGMATHILDLYRNVYYGDGTYYGSGANTGGICQYYEPGLPPAGRQPSIRSTVALNQPQLLNSFSCGMCFTVHGTGVGAGNAPIEGDFYVFVDNVCPECHEGSLDFAENGDGRWDISIQAVQCPVGDGNIEYKFQGSHHWYIKLQVRNHRIPITEMKLFQNSRNEWTPLKHSFDGFWVLDPTESWHKPLDVPLKIQMTSATGVLLNDTIEEIRNDGVIPGNVQVPLDTSLPSVHGNTATGNNNPIVDDRVTHVTTRSTTTPGTRPDISMGKTNPGILNLYRNKQTGYGTYDGAEPRVEAMCQYFPPALPTTASSSWIRATAGLGDGPMMGSLGCGMCFKVWATGQGVGTDPMRGDFYVFIDNVCSGCPGGSINLSEEGDGRWNVKIQAVQCPLGDDNIEYKFQGSSVWYLKLQTRNHRIPITKMKIYQSGLNQWTPLKHTSDGFWELDPAERWLKPLPALLRLQLTAANGAVLTDTISRITNDVVIPGNVQVPFDPSLPFIPATGSDSGDLSQADASSNSKTTPPPHHKKGPSGMNKKFIRCKEWRNRNTTRWGKSKPGY